MEIYKKYSTEILKETKIGGEIELLRFVGPKILAINQAEAFVLCKFMEYRFLGEHVTFVDYKTGKTISEKFNLVYN